MCRIN